MMRTFTMFRKAVPTETHNENQRNAPDEPQFEGAIFSDGTVAVRWCTAKRSTSVWNSMDDMLAIHGHPEYGSVLVWGDQEDNLVDATVMLPRDVAESLRDYLSQPLTASGMETHRAEADGMDDEYAALCEALKEAA